MQTSNFKVHPSGSAFICITSVVVSASRNFNEEGVIYWWQLLWRLWMSVHLINTWSWMCMCLIYSFNIVSVCSQFRWFFSRCFCLLPSQFFICDYAPGLQHTHTRFHSNNSCNQKKHTHTHRKNMSSVLKCQGNQSVAGTKGPGYRWGFVYLLMVNARPVWSPSSQYVHIRIAKALGLQQGFASCVSKHHIYWFCSDTESRAGGRLFLSFSFSFTHSVAQFILWEELTDRKCPNVLQPLLTISE